MTSPWVRRALEQARDTGRKAVQPIEPTLGDRISADRNVPLCKARNVAEARKTGVVR